MRKNLLKWTLAAGLLVAVSAHAQQPRSVSPDKFEAVHQLIKPQADESLWMQIPWLTSVWEARQQAAAQGKPIFIWAGSGGGPVAIC